MFAFVGKPADRNGDSADIDRECPRMIEDVHARVRGEERIRNRRSLVIPRNNDNRDAAVGEALERSERLQNDVRPDLAAEEDIAAMHDEIDIAAERRLERAFEVLRETGQAEVRVGEKENSDATHDTTVMRPALILSTTRSLPRDTRRRIHKRWTHSLRTGTKPCSRMIALCFLHHCRKSLSSPSGSSRNMNISCRTSG